MSSITDRLANMNYTVDFINQQINEKGSLDKASALSVREDLRCHVQRDARKAAISFLTVYPHDLQFPKDNLENLQRQGLVLSKDINNLQDNLSRACERKEDVRKISDRITHINNHITKFLQDIAQKIETNDALISQGVHVLNNKEISNLPPLELYTPILETSAIPDITEYGQNANKS